MASEFLAGMGFLKTAFDMAQGLKDINDAAIRNGAIVELLEKILAAREQQAAALERISDLEKKLARFENWEAEKQRYELADVGRGTLAYRLKPPMASGETPHSLCAYCFEERVKSPLQPETRYPGGSEHLVCHRVLPMSGWRVWIGHYKREKWSLHWTHHALTISSEKEVLQRIPGTGRPPFNTQSTTYVVGELYIHVISSAYRKAVRLMKLVPPASDLLREIWPPGKTTFWSPLRPLTDHEAHNISVAFFNASDSCSLRQAASANVTIHFAQIISDMSGRMFGCRNGENITQGALRALIGHNVKNLAASVK